MQGKACVALSRLFKNCSGAQKDNRRPVGRVSIPKRILKHSWTADRNLDSKDYSDESPDGNRTYYWKLAVF